MSIVVAFLTDLALAIPVSLVCGIATALVLWRFRAWGLWALIWCGVMEIVFIILGYAIIPTGMRYHDPHDRSISPMLMGIMVGCCYPALSIVTRYLLQIENNRQ